MVRALLGFGGLPEEVFMMAFVVTNNIVWRRSNALLVQVTIGWVK